MSWPRVDKEEPTRWSVFANVLADALASDTSTLFSFVLFLKATQKTLQLA